MNAHRVHVNGLRNLLEIARSHATLNAGYAWPGASSMMRGPTSGGIAGLIDDLADVIRSHVGIGLRRARLARGWSLRAAAEASSGRFAATSIAGYERGERAISLERYLELCRLYGVPSERLLAWTERASSDRSPPVLDVARLDHVHERHRSMIALFVDQVVARRRQPSDGRITLRAGDVQVLASVAGISSEELIGGPASSEPIDAVGAAQHQIPLR